MPTFRDLLTAADADLVRYFYRLQAGADHDFIKRINHAAAALGLNHTQLVCALGFNPAISELTDILTVTGFSSYKSLCYRRDELFTHDVYRHLSLDDLATLYAAWIDDDAIDQTRQNLAHLRLQHLEQLIYAATNPDLATHYKTEVESIYAGEVGTVEFMMRRVTSPIGDKRVLINEIEMIAAAELVPIPNLFFSDFLLPAEKRYLLASNRIERSMLENRLQNPTISEDERQVLEDFL